MPRTRVQHEADGRYTVTIPRGIAEAMDLGGDQLEWTVESSDRISAKRINEDD